MPPTGAETKVKDPEYCNWLKVSLALFYLKDGLHSFIQSEVNAMHQSLLQKLHGGSTIPTPQKCSSCKSKDVKQDRSTYIWRFRPPCPSRLCDVWLTELITLHTNPTSNKIYWENCDVTAWPFVPWECAKLYMPRGQLPANIGPPQSDAQALLTLMATCKYFHGKLSPVGLTVICTVSTIRNKVMHSGDMRLSDSDRKSFIQDIIHLLEDPTHLKSLKECKQAVDEINRINNDSVDVFFNLDVEMKALKECINDCRQELGIHKKETEKTVESLKEEFTKLKDQFDNSAKETKDKVIDLDAKCQQMATSVTKLSKSVKQQVKMLRRKADTGLGQHDKKLRKLDKEIQEVKASTSRATDQVSAKNIESDTHNLRDDLIKAYRNLRCVQVSPIFEKKRCDIDNIYVDLVIEEKQDSKNIQGDTEYASTQIKVVQSHSTKKIEVTSYKQIFQDRRGSKFKRIYLRGKGGIGKTTFCRKVLHAWCNANEGRSVAQDAYFQDEAVLQMFDLLFYLNLREVSVDENLIELICAQFPLEEVPSKNTLGALLKHNGDKVLFILDGLDEIVVKAGFIENILTRRVYPNCCFLVSSRPWKISQMELHEGPEIDLLLDLQGFSKRNAKIFAEKIFCNCYKDGNVIKQFKKDIARNKLATQLIHVPLLLLFLAQVWYENERLLPSKLHELYILFLKLLVDRMMEKYKKDPNHSQMRFTLCDTQSPFPSKISETSLVVNFGEGFLLSLCEVAHHFLLSSQKENTLVFGETELLNALGVCGEEKLDVALKLGILSVTDSVSYLNRKTSVSFIHKTMQEFFTAVYFLCNPEKLANFISSIADLNHVQQNENIIVFLVGLMPKLGNKVLEKVDAFCSDGLEMLVDGKKPENYQQLSDINNMYLRCKEEIDGKDVLLNVSGLSLDIKLKTDFDLQPWNPSCLRFLSLEYEDTDNCGNVSVDLRRFTGLTYLKILLCELDSCELYLPESDSLSVLIMNGIKLTSSCCDVLGSTLSCCTKLRRLEICSSDLRSCNLDLSNMRDLTALWLMNITCTRTCCDVLFRSLTKCTQLEKLFLYNKFPINCQLDLSQFKVLSDLTLFFVNATNYCCDFFGWSLTHCTQLKTLSLSNQSIYYVYGLGAVPGSSCFIQDITYAHSTKPLTFEPGHIDSRICQLDDSHMTTLIELSVENVQLSCCCYAILVRTLKHCTQLKTLYLRHIDLQSCLLDLSNMTVLSNLQLDEITLSSSCCDVLGRTLKHCTQLETLILKNTNLDNCQLDLSNLTELCRLELDQVTLSNSCCDVLGRTLPHCTKLNHLSLMNTYLYNCELNLFNMTALSYLVMENVGLSESACQVLEQSFNQLQSVKEDLCRYSFNIDKFSDYNSVSVECNDYNDDYYGHYSESSAFDSDSDIDFM